MIKTLVKYVGKYKSTSIWTVVLTAAEVVLDIFLPVCMAGIIDNGIEKGDISAVVRYGIIMAVLSILAFLTGVLSGRLASKASTGFVANLREAMYRKVQTFSFKNIDRFSTAGLVTRLTTDASNMQLAYQMIIRMCVRAPLNLLFAMIMCFIISPNLSTIFVIAILFLVAALYIIISRAMKSFKKVFGEYDLLNESIQENIRGIRVVKSFVREDYETEKFKKAVGRLYRLFSKAESITCYNAPVMMLTVYGCTLALSWFGAKDIVAGALTTGELSSLLSYIMNIFMSLMMLSMTFVMLTISSASAERICEVFNEVPDIQNPDNPVTAVADGSIDFEHVNFAYSSDASEYVLSDIDLHISSGQTIGIIGGTGSAKSSLVNLIPRLYDVSTGTVKVGGRDVREYDITTLRDEVSMVLQNNVLFSGTITENLRWGRGDATEEECRKACELACVDDFVESLPEKYNTRIERGGNNVSGGQKQRLCIARALIRKPKILILDDSTSAVDTATEARIQKAFDECIPETTKIIIAQRISSVKHADKIIVMEDGRVNGFGSHEELMKTNAIYQAVVEGQERGNADFDRMGV